ncbi:hypothetical protein DFH08DRAFT_987264 [Mycena albidolilacea]|uniref:Uncharacterized protein n=1 Tax=Mycena albidolilacea TaxID=1033008 RepID=A0AAD7AA33_9AGAR|nr:hypothetical protein DFH08DRAFT_987264 [Mycena albidolilacea]
MDTGRPATRQAVRAGIAPAPPPIRGTPSRSVSSTCSLDGAPSTNSPIKTSRPVTPELSFSSAVSGRPPSTPRGLGDGSGNTSPGLAHSEPNTTSNVPPLTGDVDFGLITPDEEVDDGWTPITRKTARTHSPRPVSPVDNNKSVVGTICSTPTSESTINQAEANMSGEELMRLAECHRFYADRAVAAAQRKMSSTPPDRSAVNKPTFPSSPVSPAVPSGEGASRRKEKGIDPRNFGAVPSLIDFTEDDCVAQREALANFEEINCVLKQESITPERGLFNDVPLLDLSETPAPYEEALHPSIHPNEDSDQEVEYSPPPRLIGDLYAFNAELTLEMGQPYPGDAGDIEFSSTERRFCVYRTTETQYVIMDSMSDNEHLIDDAHLRDTRFELGLWFARERQRAIGCDPLFVPLEERYTAELGDALMIGARTMLEHAHWDGVENSSMFSHFHIQDATEGKLTIMDFEEELQFLLPRALLLDQKFDLVGWFGTELEGCKRDIHDLASLSKNDEGHLEFDWLTDSDVPPLEAVSDSGSADVESDGQGIGIEATTKQPGRVPRQLGDLLEEAVRLILEVSQPYPGDERAEDDGRLQRPRLDVNRVSNGSYLVRDKYFREASMLPVAYLREPAFSLSSWYVNIRVIECGIEGFEFLRTHRATVKELLMDEVKHYLTENRDEYPVLSSVSISHILQDPDEVEEPDLFLLRIHAGEINFVDFLSEASLMNPAFDLIGWALTRLGRVECSERNLLEGFDGATTPSYLGDLFGDEPVPEDEVELFCGKAQIPADGYNGLRCMVSMPKTPNRVVAKPLVVVAHVNNQPARALIDSGSLGDLISTTMADQLHLGRSKLEDPIDHG